MLDLLKHWLERTDAPGVSVAFDDGDRIRCLGAGIVDIRTNVPVSDDVAFQLGSVSKAITAFALTEVLREKSVGVDTPVVDVAPDLKASNENAFHAVTFRHLLSHTSGMDSQWWVDLGQGSGARACAARAIAAVPLIARPGELFSYSNSGYVLAGYLTEVLDGRRWEECVEAKVAHHIGAHSITARPERILLRPVATGYGAAGKPPLPTARWYAPLALTPGGGLVATPADLARLMRVMRRCLGPGGSPAIGAESGFAVPTIGRRFDGWGLGMARYRAADGRVLWGHDGTTSSQACAVRLCEGRPETVVVAANAAWAASDVGALAQDILAELLGSGSACPAETRPDVPAGYDAWRIPADRDPSGCYARLNATTFARLGSQGELEVEEIYSPQDEANWFGKVNPQGTERIASRLHRAKGHSYMSASKEFHFLRHPDDADRLYLHDGMRASVRTHRPWW